MCFCNAKLCFHLMPQHPEAIKGPFVSGTQKERKQLTLTVLNIMINFSLNKMSLCHPLNHSKRKLICIFSTLIHTEMTYSLWIQGSTKSLGRTIYTPHADRVLCMITLYCVYTETD